jgi:phosphoribosyl 1,2-cyclic phosphate phosphodiesterase
MELHYMGTGAAEGIPATFCACPVCKEAAKRGGREIRTRSQALLNGKILFDFPPDTYAHYLTYHFDLPAIRYVLVTHSHMDHFFPAEFELRSEGFVHTPLPLMHLYGNEQVERALLAVLPEGDLGRHRILFHRLEPFQKFDIDGYGITPLLAKHDPAERCLFYLVEHGGTALLYAHDTGIFPEETWACLRSLKPRLGLVSLDCTMAAFKDGNNHMGLPDVVLIRERLLEMGLAGETTVFALNHFSHNGGLNHRALCDAAENRGFVVAWDGLVVGF